ncbi:MAG: RNA 3'-terminal phosphate cyclase [Candidatus Krumholzibacteria bacterium]|nr:RNA 3'-terminal phosphate cyclase [Candidatus Krumholzibacteria bacterium]
MDTVIEIDGSYGEGGGQVLRTALALSALTGKGTRVTNIRAGRSKPGLAPQHLTCLLAFAEVCDAAVEGAKIGSTEIAFEPAVKARPGEYTFDVSDVSKWGSAGSVTLITQALLAPLSLAAGPSRLTLKGGTHVPWSPPYDFVSDVYLPALSRMGIAAECRLVSWGFYPAGGGRISVDIEPTTSVAPLVIPERGELKGIHGRALACNLPSRVAMLMANRARNLLSEIDAPCQVVPERVRGKGPGACLFLHVEYENVVVGFSALGERGKPSEKVAEEACRELIEHDENGAPITPRLADQLLLPAALASGRTEFQTSCVTAHLLTAAWVVRQFLPAHIDIEGAEGSPGNVVIEGVGS